MSDFTIYNINEDPTIYEIALDDIDHLCKIYNLNYDQLWELSSCYVTFDPKSGGITLDNGFRCGINRKIEDAIFAEYRDAAEFEIGVNFDLRAKRRA